MNAYGEYWVARLESDGTSPSGSATRRILLVDDHDDTRFVMRAVLEQKGFEVREAATIAEADVVARSGFDLLLCDIDLPDGTGIEFLQRLTTASPVRAIAMSGYGSANDIERSLEAGFAHHLVKPFTAEKLFAAIDEASQRG